MTFEYGHLYMADMTHPLEYETTQEVMKQGLTDWVGREVAGIKEHLFNRVEANLRSYPASPVTSPRLYRLYRSALKRLRANQVYPLFVNFGYELTAQCHGSKQEGYSIVINSACLEELTDDELTALLGQQIGHIQLGHVQTMELLHAVEFGISTVPVLGKLMGKQLWTYFAKWKIASQYSADRAAVFAAGNLNAVISLLLKQMGADPETSVETIMAEPVPFDVDRLGLYFVWLSQSMPVFGGRQRIQELVQWTLSKACRTDYPALYYCARAERNDKPVSEEDAQALKLHIRAMEDDIEAASLLGKLYLTGRGGLPQASETAVSLLTQAAYAGQGESMYLLALSMQHEIGGLKNKPEQIDRLLRAAASRGYASASKPLSPVSPSKAVEELIAQVCARVASGYDADSLRFLANQTQPGQPLSATERKDVADAFWMNADETVYAAQLTPGDVGGYGAAISASGLYGRAEGEAHPFAITWSQFSLMELTSRPLDVGNAIFIGEQQVVRCDRVLKGTLAEILIRLKKEL